MYIFPITIVLLYSLIFATERTMVIYYNNGSWASVVHFIK